MATFNNKFYRVYSITTDKYGIDPLLDVLVPKISEITAYTIHNVKQDERAAPDLISYREYGSEDYWWHILVYNGICMYTDIVEGLTLKIPNFSSLVTVTNDSVLQNGSNIVVI